MAEETQPEKEKILGTGILKALKQKIADWISTRQPILVSGTNIKTVEDQTLLGSGNLALPAKTINGASIKGEGNINLQTPLVSGTSIKTVNGNTLLGSGDLTIDTGKTYSDYGNNVDGALTQKFSTEKLRGPRVEIGSNATVAHNGSVAVGAESEAAGDSSVAVGRDATTSEMYGVAVGPLTKAQTAGAVALGYNITSGTGTGSIAIGYGSKGSTLPPSTEETTSTDSTIAIGFNANAADQAAITIGNDSEARFQCMAIGNNKTKARGRRNIAIGAQAEATAESGEDSDGAIALGILSKATGAHGIAVGYGAEASARNSASLSLNANARAEGALAIGAGSTAANTNAVALGYGSSTSVDNTVSVGTSTNNRRIMNVAAGVADTDAVNKKQLDDALAGGGGGGNSDPCSFAVVTVTLNGTTLTCADGTDLTNVSAFVIRGTSDPTYLKLDANKSYTVTNTGTDDFKIVWDEDQPVKRSLNIHNKLCVKKKGYSSTDCEVINEPNTHLPFYNATKYNNYNILLSSTDDLTIPAQYASGVIILFRTTEDFSSSTGLNLSAVFNSTLAQWPLKYVDPTTGTYKTVTKVLAGITYQCTFTTYNNGGMSIESVAILN